MLFIDALRTGRAVNQCGETMTVQDMIDYLEGKVNREELSPEEPIYLIDDNGGYGCTFGEINRRSIQRGYQEPNGRNHFEDEDGLDEWEEKIMNGQI